MEKKHIQRFANQRGYTQRFFLGLIAALSVSLIAFEYRTYYDISELGDLEVEDTYDIEEILEPIVVEKVPELPEPKPQPKPQPVPVINPEPVIEPIEPTPDPVFPDPDILIANLGPALKNTKEKEVDENRVYDVGMLEENPVFPGGEEGIFEYLRDNMRYPKMAKREGIKGTVYVSFVVMKDGTVGDIEILRGIGGGCDREAIRVIQNMPVWEPGKQMGKPVKVRFRLPIRFVLQ